MAAHISRRGFLQGVGGVAALGVARRTTPAPTTTPTVVFEPLPPYATALFANPVTFPSSTTQRELFLAAADSDLPVDFPPGVADEAVAYTKDRLLHLIASSRLLVTTPTGGQPQEPVQVILVPDEHGALTALTISAQFTRRGDFNGPRERFFGNSLYNGPKMRPTYVAPQAAPLASAGLVRQDILTMPIASSSDPKALSTRLEVTGPNPTQRSYLRTTNYDTSAAQVAAGRTLYYTGMTTPAYGYTLGDYNILALLSLILRLQHDGHIENDTRFGLIDSYATIYRLAARNDFQLLVHGIEWAASGKPRLTDERAAFDLHVTWDDNTGTLQTLTCRVNEQQSFSHTGYAVSLFPVPLFNPQAGERWDPQALPDEITYDGNGHSDPGSFTVPISTFVARMPKYGTIPWHGI